MNEYELFSELVTLLKNYDDIEIVPHGNKQKDKTKHFATLLDDGTIPVYNNVSCPEYSLRIRVMVFACTHEELVRVTSELKQYLDGVNAPFKIYNLELFGSPQKSGDDWVRVLKFTIKE